MKEKIWHWITTGRMKLLLVLLLLTLNIIVLAPTYFIEKYVNTACLLLGVIAIYILLIREYKKSKRISKIYLVTINVISMVNFLFSSGVGFNASLLRLRAVLFLGVVALGLIVVWKAKKSLAKQFTSYLVLSLLTVVLNFGGFYEALYSMYSPYGQESFKIDQNMSWSQAVMPVDFIYYSADAFFGTDISDVSIKYIDYMELYNEDSTVAKHEDKYKSAIKIIQIAKIFSVIESVLFIVYISIVVMSIENVKEGTNT